MRNIKKISKKTTILNIAICVIVVGSAASLGTYFFMKYKKSDAVVAETASKISDGCQQSDIDQKLEEMQMQINSKLDELDKKISEIEQSEDI